MITTQSQKTPRLRFPEFKEEWKTYKLSEFLKKYSENNKDEEFSLDEILSLSSHYGIVSRKELLEDTYSNVNHLNYKKTRLNDLVYGKSISANYPFGLFKVNDYKDGLLSTLYFTFKVSKNVYPKFLDCYFSHTDRVNSFLKKYVLVGDRYITVDPDYLLTGKINLPTLPEQQKIVEFIKFVDEMIKNLKEQKEALGEYKKGILQKIFSQEIRFKDDNKKSFLKWEECMIGQIIKEYSDKDNSKLYEVVAVGKYGIRKRGDIYSKELSKDISKNKVIKQNTLTIGIGSTQIDIGVLLEDHMYSVSPAYSTFNIITEKINPFFLKELFVFLNKKLSILYMITGARQGKSINKKDFMKHVLILPSLPEQKKIADFLTSLDKAIEAKQQQINLAEGWKKGLMQGLFI